MIVIPVKTKGSNTYIIKDKRSIIVDTGGKGNVDRILNVLQDEGISIDDISLIIITHAHIDHYGSVKELKKKVAAPVLIHKEDASDMEQGVISSLYGRNKFAKMILPFFETKTKEGYKADIVIDKNISLVPYGVSGEIICTPGHTNGSISVFLENKVAIIGDLLMGGSLGGLINKTQPNLHYFVNNKYLEKKSIQSLQEKTLHTIYVGHGGPLNMTQFSSIAF
ncbi:MBL fold metallo-hydrolase [Shouchella clausii]|uniref:MBL fold metallo-hydrolase n=1 Tax=Shouchella clausii TaxID=79880 RepID=UPI00079AB00A|nr:MBL fold metallo-hydrolase [Shouchella clausii]KKI86119.1 hypothetical protein WZ76_12090 [Shouchella clausii]MCM3310891.1 MBL fold metallo-hydrolase [Psychrobacillus sp. MER TA 17]